MLFILLNFILLLLLPNPTLQTKVTIASSDRVRDQPRWAAQICNNYIATQCCAPLDLEVPGVGRGWFRGTFAQFDQLPALSLYVSVWQAQGKGYTCDGPTVGDDVTDAEPTVLYNDADGVGIGGTWYTVWITGANKTVAAANSEVVYPDQIMYDGELYTAMHTVERLFHSPTGRLIFGHPFGVGSSSQLRLPTISKDLSGDGWLRLKKPNSTKTLSGGGAGRVGYQGAPVSVDTSK